MDRADSFSSLRFNFSEEEYERVERRIYALRAAQSSENAKRRLFLLICFTWRSPVFPESDRPCIQSRAIAF